MKPKVLISVLLSLLCVGLFAQPNFSNGLKVKGELRVDSIAITGNELGIPEYDPSNPEHWLIDSQADFDSIVSTTKKYFFVAPGTYSSVDFTGASGNSDSDRKYMLLYDNSDEHPAKLPVDQQANINNLYFPAISNWTFYRLSSISNGEGINGDYCADVRPYSTNLTFYKCNYENFYHGGILFYGDDAQPDIVNNFEVAYCRFNQSLRGIDNDAVAILASSVGNPPGDRILRDVWIHNNEFYNCNDGVQPKADQDDTVDIFYDDFIIEHNDFWVDEQVYTDGDSADIDFRNASYALTENALDIKAGSFDSTKTMIIRYNKMWGYRITDQTGGASGSWGAAMTIHYWAYNLLIHDNLIFNCNRGISMGDANDDNDWACDSVIIRDNIFYNNGYRRPYYDDNADYNIYINESKRVKVSGNVIRDTSNIMSRWMSLTDQDSLTTVSENVVINSYNHAYTGTLDASVTNSSNWLYATDTVTTSGLGTWYANASDANMKDTTFTVNKFSNNPYTITLPGVVSTRESPHYTGNLLENGTFLNGFLGWDVSETPPASSVTKVAGGAHFQSDATGQWCALAQRNFLTVGQDYEFTIVISQVTSGGLKVGDGAGDNNIGTWTSAGTYTVTHTALDEDVIMGRSSWPCDLVVESVSIKRVG